MSDKKTNQAVLNRLKAKLKIGQLALGVTTAIFSSAMARSFLDGHDPWIVAIGGFVGGWTGYMVLDDTLDLYISITIKQWGNTAIVAAKKKLAISTAIFTAVLLLFSGTLTLLSNRVTSKAIAGKDPVTVELLSSKLNEVTTGKIKEQSGYNQIVLDAEKNVMKIEKQAIENVAAAINAGGNDFEKLWNSGNSWVRSATKTAAPAIYRARENVYKVQKEEKQKIEAANAALIKIRQQALSLSEKATTAADKKSSAIETIAVATTENHTSYMKNIRVGLGVAEVMIMFYVIFLIVHIITFCKSNDVDFGEPPIGIDGFIKLVMNRAFGFIQINALAGFAKVDKGLRTHARKLDLAGVLNTPSIMSIISEEGAMRAPTPTRSAFAPTERPTIPTMRPTMSGIIADSAPRQPQSVSPTGIAAPTKEKPDSMPTMPTAPDKYDTFYEKVLVEVSFQNEMKEIEIEVHKFGRGDYRVKTEWKRGDEKGLARFLTLAEIRKDIAIYMRRAQDGSEQSKDNYLFYAAAEQAILSQK